LIYQHYKNGKNYRILHHAKDVYGEVDVIVYVSLYDGKIWVRSHSEFFGQVEHDGKKVQRFRPLDTKELLALSA
jgi:hypothetical protein